jgi:hypothetical protein
LRRKEPSRDALRLPLDLDNPQRKTGYPSGDLQQERNRLAKPVREQLWRYYPQALAISDDLATDWFTRTVGRGADT